MWLTRYLFPTQIMYDQVSTFIVHKFRRYLIEKQYGIKSKTGSTGNPTYNTIFERIHSVLGSHAHKYYNKDIYVDEYNQWIVILAEEVFTIFSKANSIKDYTP